MQMHLGNQMGEPKIEIINDPDVVEVFLSSGFSDAFVQKVQRFFKRQTKDYIIVIKNITIEEELKTQTNYGTTNPGAPGMGGGAPAMATTSQSSYAYVKVEVEVWDVKQMKKVYAYDVSDKATVTLLMYGAALRSAVNKTIKSTVKYIAANGVHK